MGGWPHGPLAPSFFQGWREMADERWLKGFLRLVSLALEQKLKHVESFGDQEHVARNKERYVMLEEKTKELGYKVKKHMQDLSSRISRARHNEL